MSWKETDKNIQLKAGLDKDRKIRVIAKWDPRSWTKITVGIKWATINKLWNDEREKWSK